MMLADVGGARREAERGLVGSCPSCRALVIPKCGTLVVHHWAHERDADCDHWAEGETRWHSDWKNRFPPDAREVVIGCHRADAVTPNGMVVEFQHSGISETEIEERERFYGNMVWVFDAREQADRIEFTEEPTCPMFRWPHAKASVLACAKPVYLDLGDPGVLLIGRIYAGLGVCEGWGIMTTQHEMVTSWHSPYRAARA